ncbi:solute carrier family 22 member 4-like isoform X2 [Periplaneta americana]|uniref:solute carrier family 22 member 4-like isoform X2 n=1 Tax=Periplaneta americana TaxID=6978 RepID=UPI0037E81039
MDTGNIYIVDIDQGNQNSVQDSCGRSCEPSARSPESQESMDLDEILDELGHFGKFQLISFLLISFPIIFSATFALSYIFTAGDLNYRCHIPECEGMDTTFDTEWLRNAVPFQQDSTDVPSRCLRFAFLKEKALGFSENKTLQGYNDSVCTEKYFDRNTTVKCDKWVYEEGITILREWDITCEENRWALTIVGTINNVGQFIGMPIAGMVSDRIGRKRALVIAVFLAAIMGITRSLAWSYTSFLVFEFLDPLCGSGLYTAGFVLGMELVGPKGRVFAGTIVSVFYTIGEVILGCVSLWLQNWRLILRVIYIPALLCVAHYWLATESVRWLLAKGRTKEASEIVLKAARTNGVTLPQQLLNKLRASADTKNELAKQQGNNGARKETMIQIFQSRILLKRLIISAFCWFSTTFVFFGLSLNSVSVGGNKYTNFILGALIEVPAYITFYLCLDRIGRKYTLCISFILSGISCIAFAFMPTDMDNLQLALFLMGKFGITTAFAVVFVFTAELFPTELRHSMLGTCSMLGRIGSVIAPQTPLLGQYLKSLPLLLFGTMSVLSGLLSFTFPETLHLKLPDTIEEAENIGKKREN